MKKKLILCVLALVSALLLLNSNDSIMIEAGKGVMVLSILSFYAMTQIREVVQEAEVFDEEEQKVSSMRSDDMFNQKVA